MDIESIVEKLKPLDYHIESRSLTTLFPDNVIIIFREWEDNEIMWHIFKDGQSLDTGVSEQESAVNFAEKQIKNKQIK